MEPTTLSIALKALSQAGKAKDARAVRARLDRLEQQLDLLGRHLADEIVTEVRAGFGNLETAASVADPALRRDELMQARTRFARLAEHAGDDLLLDSYGRMTADHVAALGHYGNYHYFLLWDQPEHALRQAYLCTERFPVLGIRLFPPELFERDHRPDVAGVATRREWELAYRAAKDEHAKERRRWGLEMAWRVPAAAGAVLGFLAAGAVSPPLAPRGIAVAGQILGRSPELPSAPAREVYLERAAGVERRLAPVVAEAARRRRELERRLFTEPPAPNRTAA